MISETEMMDFLDEQWHDEIISDEITEQFIKQNIVKADNYTQS